MKVGSHRLRRFAQTGQPLCPHPQGPILKADTQDRARNGGLLKGFHQGLSQGGSQVLGTGQALFAFGAGDAQKKQAQEACQSATNPSPSRRISERHLTVHSHKMQEKAISDNRGTADGAYPI